MAVFNGTSGDNKITGTSGSDQIYGNGGVDKLSGGGGNDYIEALNARGLTGLNGQGGNDTLVGRVESWGQIHMRGGEGNDRLIMDMTNDRGHQGHHAYGGTGADRFDFRYTDRANTNTLGRIDDLNASRDSVYVDGARLNFSSLP